MFSFLKNKGPEIQKQIDKAILEEKRRLESIKEDINIRLHNNGEIDVVEYDNSINLLPSAYVDDSGNIYKKEDFIVSKASSREMFQTLNKICSDAEYDVKNDSVSGTVKGYFIFMMRQKGIRGYYVSISATVISRYSYIQQCINEYKSLGKKQDIPEFIKKMI